MLSRQVFPDAISLADAFAAEVADRLQAAVAAKGYATMAVSGGSTPKLFFTQLSEMPVDWEQVTITLVDDRWVDPSSERSNARLVRETLLVNEAENAKFLPITTDHPTPEEGIDTVIEKLQSLAQPFDVVVLGMGTDGHTASFFPNGDNLAAAIDPDGTDLLVAMRAPGANEPRITFSYPALIAAENIYLHIEGSQKADVLADVFQDGEAEQMPVRVFLWQDQKPVNLFWCP
jgi:6-phosphogluconolactonase